MKILRPGLTALVSLMLLSGLARAQFVVGLPAPEINLAQFGGGTLSLSNYQGRIVFIYIFGSY